MCIVTGPRIDLAIALIDRMKRLFAGKGLITFDTKETVIELNNVKIEAFPSHHLDAMRGLPNVSFILLDEADFFPPPQQQDARDVSERYIAKSNPYIVMVSTSNAPDGLFERVVWIIECKTSRREESEIYLIQPNLYEKRISR
jgi:late competence protein required for DNA uptake (superfamily II DNA/RNA helicase)